MFNRRKFMQNAAFGVMASALGQDIVHSQEVVGRNIGGYATGKFNVENEKKRKEDRSSGIDGDGTSLLELKRPLRIFIMGAHPDDAELKAGGTAALMAAKGWEVTFCSLTNGDMGHWKNTGKPLAARRKAEALQTDSMLGGKTLIFDIGDTTLMPTHENRLKLIRAIREAKADIVMGHRPFDYQADHRYAGILMQDTAFMVAVPGVLPDVPTIPNPVYLYLYDYFKRPNPFIPDIAVDIDTVESRKVDAINKMESQFYEGGCMSSDALLPKDAEGQKKRRADIRETLHLRNIRAANAWRTALIKRYGQDRGSKVQNAEFFEICEYGRTLSPEEINFIF